MLGETNIARDAASIGVESQVEIDAKKRVTEEEAAARLQFYKGMFPGHTDDQLASLMALGPGEHGQGRFTAKEPWQYRFGAENPNGVWVSPEDQKERMSHDNAAHNAPTIDPINSISMTPYDWSQTAAYEWLVLKNIGDPNNNAWPELYMEGYRIKVDPVNPDNPDAARNAHIIPPDDISVDNIGEGDRQRLNNAFNVAMNPLNQMAPMLMDESNEIVSGDMQDATGNMHQWMLKLYNEQVKQTGGPVSAQYVANEIFNRYGNSLLSLQQNETRIRADELLNANADEYKDIIKNSGYTGQELLDIYNNFRDRIILSGDNPDDEFIIDTGNSFIMEAIGEAIADSQVFKNYEQQLESEGGEVVAGEGILDNPDANPKIAQFNSNEANRELEEATERVTDLTIKLEEAITALGGTAGLDPVFGVDLGQDTARKVRSLTEGLRAAEAALAEAKATAAALSVDG